MNLSELATFICTKINQSEADDVAACKSFLTARAKMLWNVALWKDSLVSFAQTLSSSGYAVTSTWLPTKGVLLCPTIIERVVAARIDSRRLSVQRQEFYYNIDYDTFSKSGQVSEFVLLPPCVWEWDTAPSVSLLRYDEGDVSAVVNLETLASDGIEVTRQTVTLAEAATALTATERVDAMTKKATTGVVAIGNVVGITCVNATAYTATFSTVAGSVVVGPASSGVCPSTAAVTDINVTFGGAIPGNGLSGLTFGFGTATADAGTGLLSYDGSGFGTLSRTQVVALTAAATAASRRQRIRLLQIPTENTTIRVLGKRFMPTFENDLDTVPISGSENCLLAFAQADMLQRERQYGKARELQQEAIGLLDQLKDLEVVQQAHHVQITPGDGFVSEWQFNAGAYYPLTF